MPQVISVSEFTQILNEVMGEAFPQVVIEGEVSGWKVWQGRLVFFDIKDDQSSLSCMVPLASVRVPVEDGMDIRITASPRLTDKGKFSLTVRSLELTGEGALKRAYELLKAKLSSEGLFAPERKRSLPAYPETIGLVTAPGSAAYADFMKILDARWGGVVVRFFPVQVQGAVAPEQIVGALRQLSEAAEPVDVVVLIRGGGGVEDLQAFNDEAVVRAVASSRIPTIVGVGHEIDTSLADLAADVRAATPTDAAQRVVPNRVELERRLRELAQTMTSSLKRHQNERAQHLTNLHLRLDHFLARPTHRIETLAEQLNRAVAKRLEADERRLDHAKNLLAAVSPRAILARGYALARVNGRIIRSATGLEVGQGLMVELATDKIDTTINEVHHG